MAMATGYVKDKRLFKTYENHVRKHIDFGLRLPQFVFQNKSGVVTFAEDAVSCTVGFYEGLIKFLDVCHDYAIQMQIEPNPYKGFCKYYGVYPAFVISSESHPLACLDLIQQTSEDVTQPAYWPAVDVIVSVRRGWSMYIERQRSEILLMYFENKEQENLF